MGSFGSSAPLPPIPSPDSAPTSPCTFVGALLPPNPAIFPRHPELLLHGVPPGLLCCHSEGMWLLFVFSGVLSAPTNSHT